MNKNTFGVFMFTVGATIGSVVTWKLIEKKYKDMADEEIKSVIEVFNDRFKSIKNDESKKDEKTDDLNKDESNFVNYTALAKRYKNDSDDGKQNKTEKEEGEKMSTPYVISPDEFGETDYETQSLTYYADNVLTDEMDNIIENVDILVGVDSLNHFGDYEDDSVFVRNDDISTDFEILLDMRKYSDVIGDDSHPVDDE